MSVRDVVQVGTIWLGSTGNRMKVLAVDTECEPGDERALLGYVDDPEDQSWETFSSVVKFFGRAPCPSKLGIGMEVMCSEQEGHVPPHCLEGYGGLWVRWRVEWFTVAEEERDAVMERRYGGEDSERCEYEFDDVTGRLCRLPVGHDGACKP